MIYYLAGAESFEDLLIELEYKSWLVSYYHFKNLHKITNQRVFLDSGAFTAWSKGKEIDIDKYTDYLKKNGDKFECYANLDVIGDPEATLKNQNYLQSKGVTPVPTFHFGGDMKFLEYYAKNYDYIALGGLVPYARQKIKLNNWLNKCFKILMPYIKNGLKVHGFGVGSANILTKYPFYSADSTSWLQGGKFGTIVTWNPQSFKMEDGGHYDDKDTFLIKGADLKIQGHYNERLKHNAKQYKLMEEDLTRLWESRGITYAN